MITWLLADRNFPYLLGLLVLAASLAGTGLGFAVAKFVYRERPAGISWEALD